MKIKCPLSAAARRNPEATAIRQDAESLSFAQLDAAVAQASAFMKAEGCRAGSYVALLMPNTPRTVVCLLALVRLGAIACPLNTRNPPQVLRGQLRRLGCRRLIAPHREAEALDEPGVAFLDPEALSRCENHRIRKVAMERDPPVSSTCGRAKDWEGRRPSSRPPISSRLLNDGRHDEIFDQHTLFLDPGRPAVALFTSGSTATPKVALLTLGNLVSNAQASNQVNSLRTGDCWLLSLPLFHVGGLGILFRCLESGAAVAVGRKAETLGEALARYPISHMSLVPTQLQRLLDERLDPEIAARLKCILLGGAPASDALVRQALQAGLPVRKTYGLTEMASQVTAVAPSAPADKQLTAGRLLPGCELMAGKDGELWVRGTTRFAGYVEAGRVDCPFDAGGWFATGDLGRLDSEGYLTVLGRKDNLFITGGENVQPEEIEEALCALEGVAQALVVPVEDREFGLRPVAFVRMATGTINEQELGRRLQAVLPRYKIPLRFFAWPDAAQGLELKVSRAVFIRHAVARITSESSI